MKTDAIRPYRHLTEACCRQVARTCTTMKEFWTRCRSVAIKANREGWIDSYTWLARERARRNSLTEEACRRTARRFRTARQFRTEATSAYVTASRKGWLRSYTWLDREIAPKRHMSREDVLGTASKFKTLKEFRETCPNEYHRAWENGWLGECTWLKPTRPGRGNR